MARARNLKPGFFRNADLAELPVETRLLFAGLWTLADRNGRMQDRPRQVKMEIFPADSFDVDSMLNALQQAGFILRYEVDGVRYLEVVNFLKHQNPHHREPESACPPPSTANESWHSGCSPGPAQGKDEAGPGLAVLIPDPGFLNPDSGSKQQQGATTVGPRAPVPENPNPNPCGAVLDGQAAAPSGAHVEGEQTPPPGENPPALDPCAGAVTARATAIAVLLRGGGAGVAAGEVRLREWAERGVTDAELLAALATARQRREDAGSLQPVNSGLLDAILADAVVPSGGARASPRGGGKQAARERYVADADRAAQRLNLDTGGQHGRTERDISGECARVT